MKAKVIKVGSSLGLIIPKYVAAEGGFILGTNLELNLNNGKIVITKRDELRKGWKDAFSKYAKEGEDEMLIPDFVDTEIDCLI